VRGGAESLVDREEIAGPSGSEPGRNFTNCLARAAEADFRTTVDGTRWPTSIAVPYGVRVHVVVRLLPLVRVSGGPACPQPSQPVS